MMSLGRPLQWCVSSENRVAVYVGWRQTQTGLLCAVQSNLTQQLLNLNFYKLIVWLALSEIANRVNASSFQWLNICCDFGIFAGRRWALGLAGARARIVCDATHGWGNWPRDLIFPGDLVACLSLNSDSKPLFAGALVKCYVESII